MSFVLWTNEKHFTMLCFLSAISLTAQVWCSSVRLCGSMFSFMFHRLSQSRDTRPAKYVRADLARLMSWKCLMKWCNHPRFIYNLIIDIVLKESIPNEWLEYWSINPTWLICPSLMKGFLLTFNTQLSVTITLAPGAPVANLSMRLNSVLMLVATEPQQEWGGCMWACMARLIGWLFQWQRDQ